MTLETGGSEDSERGNAAEAELPVQTSETPVQAPGPEETTLAGPQQVEGRRTQLRIVRENIQSLSKDVGSFRKSHEMSTKTLEKQLASLRSELAAHTRSKDVANLGRSHEANAKKLEKQVATLRNEMAALKSSIAKDAARSRAKQEALLSKILAKVGAKPSKPAKRATKR